MSLARALKYAVNAGSKQNVFSASKVFSRFSSITTWNKDWKPGPYPKTEEERIAAAKKYHMLPEDYEPYPEEEGYGDYPKFQAIHMENLSDHNLYDFPVLKRNFCEPLHPDFDMCQEDRVNFQKDYRTPIWKMYLYVITAAVVYSSVMVYCEKYHPFMEEKLASKNSTLTEVQSHTHLSLLNKYMKFKIRVLYI